MDDALERLKKRQRPTVPARDLTLTSSPPDVLKPESLDTPIPGYQEAKTSKSQNKEQSRSSGSVDTSTSRHPEAPPPAAKPKQQSTKTSGSVDTSTSRYLDINKPEPVELQTKQTTMRLETEISDRLQDLCRKHNVSREVLIEALLVNFDSNPQIQDAVLTEAEERHQRRLAISNRKRAKSMSEKYGL
ncbi:MAG: hypothetical protein HC866_17880 [Leptolyngbyaceae cyanobacterium RU_5_1]|nr:hypothetical protein [Leptolyngbyaceae cyanobacterium RU_5_1]